MTAPTQLRLTPPDAESVIAELVRVLLGRHPDLGKWDRGLMSLMIGGEQHVPKCPKGQYLVAGDSLRGGQPCSDRCVLAWAAIGLAAEWFRAREQQSASIEAFGEQGVAAR